MPLVSALFLAILILAKQGDFDDATAYAAGKSERTDKFDCSDASKVDLGAAIAGGGPFAVGQMIGGALGSIDKSKAKLQEEQTYCEIVLNNIGAAPNDQAVPAATDGSRPSLSGKSTGLRRR